MNTTPGSLRRRDEVLRSARGKLVPVFTVLFALATFLTLAAPEQTLVPGQPPAASLTSSISTTPAASLSSSTLTTRAPASPSGPDSLSKLPPRRALTFEERVDCQRRIAEVYWAHRLWPAENRGPKPPLDVVMPESAIRAKVEDYLKKSNALEDIWSRPITALQLQTEMARMSAGTKSPDILRELFATLDDDPFLIAECLVRPRLADRMIRAAFAPESQMSAGAADFESWWALESIHHSIQLQAPAAAYEVRAPESSGSCEPGTWRPTPVPYVPTRLAGHTAIWTGSEMIIWGGADTDYCPSCPFSQLGMRYNPATDEWHAIAITPETPFARLGHAAIWTGTEMIVYGGHEDPGELRPVQPTNTGGRYNPLTDTWTRISTLGAPATIPASSGRFPLTGHVLWTGHEMLVWGEPPRGYRYDPSRDEWTTIADSPAELSAEAAFVWTGSEVIAWGGGLPGEPGFGARYDPDGDAWTPISTTGAPETRNGHVAAWTGHEMVIWGGEIGGWLNRHSFNDGALYDPVSDNWSSMSPPPYDFNGGVEVETVWYGQDLYFLAGYDGGLAFFYAYRPITDSWRTPAYPQNHEIVGVGYTVVLADKQLITFGGFGDVTLDYLGARYDMALDNWTPVGNGCNLLLPLEDHTSVWTGTEMIIWGGRLSYGYQCGRYNPSDSGYLYDPVTDSWSVVGPSSPAGPGYRDAHSAVWTGTEMIVWGGEHYPLHRQTGLRYNPTTGDINSTSIGPNVPAGRWSHTAVWTGDAMIVWGGLGANNDPLQSGGNYDPTTDSWSPVGTGPDTPSARSLHTAVWTGEEMIVWGGFDGTNRLDTGARYDPVSDGWKPTSLGPTTPSPRESHTAVWSGREMIVWGGTDSMSALNTGASYDPRTDTWSPTGIGGGVPWPRRQHTAVWTGQEMIVWGGREGPGWGPFFDNGGRYSPPSGTWVRLDSDDVVPARWGHTAVVTGEEMIIWGGSSGTSTNTGGAYCYAP